MNGEIVGAKSSKNKSRESNLTRERFYISKTRYWKIMSIIMMAYESTSSGTLLVSEKCLEVSKSKDDGESDSCEHANWIRREIKQLLKTLSTKH